MSKQEAVSSRASMPPRRSADAAIPYAKHAPQYRDGARRRVVNGEQANFLLRSLAERLHQQSASVPALLKDRSPPSGREGRHEGGMEHKVEVARLLMRLLATRSGIPTCFGCLERELRVARVFIEEVAIGAASAVSNVQVRPARCSSCGATVPTVCYRVDFHAG